MNTFFSLSPHCLVDFFQLTDLGSDLLQEGFLTSRLFLAVKVGFVLLRQADKITMKQWIECFELVGIIDERLRLVTVQNFRRLP